MIGGLELARLRQETRPGGHDEPLRYRSRQDPANYQPLTPLVFLQRAANTFPDHPAIIHGKKRYSYAEFYDRSRRLASALAALGIGKNDTVSVMLANSPAMLEAHYGVPMTGAVLHAINTRLDPPVIAFMLDHADTKVMIVDTEFAPWSRRPSRSARAAARHQLPGL